MTVFRDTGNLIEQLFRGSHLGEWVAYPKQCSPLLVQLRAEMVAANSPINRALHIHDLLYKNDARVGLLIVCERPCVNAITETFMFNS